MHQAATGTSERVKQHLWLPSKLHRQATGPATVSDYEQLKLDVAAVVVDLEGNLMRAVECDTSGEYSSRSSPLQYQNNVTIIMVEDSCSISMRKQRSSDAATY